MEHREHLRDGQRDLLQLLGGLYVAILLTAILFVVIDNANRNNSQDRQLAFERDTTLVLYRNQLQTCSANNVTRRIVHNLALDSADLRSATALTVSDATLRRLLEHAARRARDAARHMESVPYGKPDGTRDCRAAIAKPPPSS